QQHQAGLQRREGDRGRRLHGAVVRFAGEPVHARRDVDGEDGRATGFGCAVRASETRAVRGVDHEIGGAQPAAFRVRSIDDVDAHAAASQPRRCRATVVAVVALARDHHDSPSVRAPQHGDRLPGHGPAGAVDEHLDGLWRGTVDGAHLLGGDDRQHRYSATTNATATSSECVSDRWKTDAPRSAASAAALPCNTTDGAPSSSRSTSTSWNPNAPSPTPSDFITASFAAKRAAYRSTRFTGAFANSQYCCSAAVKTRVTNEGRRSI